MIKYYSLHFVLFNGMILHIRMILMEGKMKSGYSSLLAMTSIFFAFTAYAGVANLSRGVA